MRAKGYNFLKWPAPAGGWAVRQLEGGPPEFWVDADGAFVGGDDPNFCLSVDGRQDKWLFADSQGNPQKPSALANVPEANAGDTATLVRIVPAGGYYPPIPAGTPDDTYTCYRIGLRCLRLMLVQNAALAADGTCDLSAARIQWLAPRDTDAVGSGYEVARPILYPAGDGELPSELASVDHQCEVAPSRGGVSGTVYPKIDDNGKLVWVTTEDQSGRVTHLYRDTEGNPSMYVRDYWKRVLENGDWMAERHELYWAGAASVDTAENVAAQLAAQSGLVGRVFGLDGDDIPAGTAFDMVLLCKTYYWYLRRNFARVIHHPHGDETRTTWTCCVADYGYFNTKLCGYLAQVVPVPPRERSVA